MFLKKVEIPSFKVLQAVNFSFEQKEKHKIFPIISVNGGGKSTLIQFIFAFLHLPFRPERQVYLENMLDFYELENRMEEGIAKFSLEFEGKTGDIEFIVANDERIVTQTVVLKKEKKSFLESLEEEIEIFGGRVEEVQSHEIEVSDQNKDYRNQIYLLSFKKNILLCKTVFTFQELQAISDKIYLAAPNTQVFHFFDDERLKSLFENKQSHSSSYEYYIKECKEVATGLFTYEFSVIPTIFDALEKAKQKDFFELLKNGQYGDTIHQTLRELNGLLMGKNIKISEEAKGVVFSSAKTKKPLTPKDLSHGELKKLSIFAWLKTVSDDGAIVLMDEVDMGLHPTWQQDLYYDLQKWSPNTQFILATHSPQIISRAYYKNLVVINRDDEGNTSTEQFTEAPLESDLNTVVKVIMGGDYMPKEVEVLQEKYRHFAENDTLDTPEAEAIKAQLLEYESENSTFFQNLKFELELR